MIVNICMELYLAKGSGGEQLDKWHEGGEEGRLVMPVASIVDFYYRAPTSYCNSLLIIHDVVTEHT